MSQSTKMENIIVLFEDTPKSLIQLKQELETRLYSKKVRIIDFSESDWTSVKEISKSIEIVENFLTQLPVEIAIVDLDLTQYKQIDINEPVISNVCNKHGIPACVYHAFADEAGIEEIKSWPERKIILNSNQTFDQIAEQCSAIYRGFKHIREVFLKTKTDKKLGPIELLSKAMKAPNGVESQIALYATGYINMLTDEIAKPEIRHRMIPTLLGYWLYNSLLRFPGILLNEIATASYLDIDVAVFSSRDDIKSIFDEAKYVGPFNELGPYWWKDGLDELLSDVESNGKISMGRTLLKLKGLDINNILRARCIEGDHDGAGFYCILKREPVCVEHSEGNISWLPAGATLSRISNSKWDELGPWFGF